MPTCKRDKITLADKMNVAELEVTHVNPKSKNQFVISVEESGANLSPNFNSNLYLNLGTCIQSKQFPLDVLLKRLESWSFKGIHTSPNRQSPKITITDW